MGKYINKRIQNTGLLKDDVCYNNNIGKSVAKIENNKIRLCLQADAHGVL